MLFEKTNKIDKFLGSLPKKGREREREKREKAQIINMKNQTTCISTDNVDMKRIIRE